jgi:hypothetical protein
MGVLSTGHSCGADQPGGLRLWCSFRACQPGGWSRIMGGVLPPGAPPSWPQRASRLSWSSIGSVSFNLQALGCFALCSEAQAPAYLPMLPSTHLGLVGPESPPGLLPTMCMTHAFRNTVCEDTTLLKKIICVSGRVPMGHSS